MLLRRHKIDLGQYDAAGGGKSGHRPQDDAAQVADYVVLNLRTPSCTSAVRRPSTSM